MQKEKSIFPKNIDFGWDCVDTGNSSAIITEPGTHDSLLMAFSQ